jgi:N-acetyl-anhydromuramyl-L-alanine amidase AmpD
MDLSTAVRSPNFTDRVIPVRFVVLHFTATSLERTLEIFADPKAEASAHLVIDRDGGVHEVVECLSGSPRRAWHAGKSRLESVSLAGSKIVDNLNDCSLGIELVNLNGNLFPYSEAQYAALFKVIDRLKGLYPDLATPEAVVGHEHVAGFRGKGDPGWCFEWGRLFSVCYAGQGMPSREPLYSEQLVARARQVIASLGIVYDPDSDKVSFPAGVADALCEAALCEAGRCEAGRCEAGFFEAFSSLMESALGFR